MITNQSFSKITYGLYLVSTEHNGKQNGYIANTVFQLTSDPARFAISCSKDNLSAELITTSGKFTFTVLEKDVDQNIISRFGYKSGKETDKYEGLEYFGGEMGNPIIKQDAIAYFECELEKTIDVGTHLLFIGLLKSNELLSDKDPLTYADYRNLRNGKAPKNAPTYIKPEAESIPLKKGQKEIDDLTKYECLVCGHIYDPAIGDEESGIPPGTPFSELPDDWACPDCGAEKEEFIPLD